LKPSSKGEQKRLWRMGFPYSMKQQHGRGNKLLSLGEIYNSSCECERLQFVHILRNSGKQNWGLKEGDKGRLCFTVRKKLMVSGACLKCSIHRCEFIHVIEWDQNGVL
jgi:hypothetical protein